MNKKLLILHGWTYQTATWNPLFELLKERGIEYEFLQIPGLTDGSNPEWTLDDYVEWLHAKTITHDKVILYGHSNGGRISIAFALKYPEKVARLILEDSAGVPPRGLRKLKRDLFRIAAQIVGTAVRLENLRRIFRRAIRASDYANATPEMRKTMANLVAVDLRPALHRIQCPTLIIWGRGDTTTPLADGLDINQGINASRMEIIDDARHSPHITHPILMAELIQKELA